MKHCCESFQQKVAVDVPHASVCARLCGWVCVSGFVHAQGVFLF